LKAVQGSKLQASGRAGRVVMRDENNRHSESFFFIRKLDIRWKVQCLGR
jgi:hypothetical protein